MKKFRPNNDMMKLAPEITVPWENYTTSRRSCAEVYLSLLEGLAAITFVCPASLQLNLLRTIADLIIEQIHTKFGMPTCCTIINTSNHRILKLPNFAEFIF